MATSKKIVKNPVYINDPDVGIYFLAQMSQSGFIICSTSQSDIDQNMPAFVEDVFPDADLASFMMERLYEHVKGGGAPDDFDVDAIVAELTGEPPTEVGSEKPKKAAPKATSKTTPASDKGKTRRHIAK